MKNRRLLGLVAYAGLAVSFSCGPVTLGNRPVADPRRELKVGHDHKADVLRKLGEPTRRFVDSQGLEIWSYVWADGRGGGQKSTIAFNSNDVLLLVEVEP